MYSIHVSIKFLEFCVGRFLTSLNNHFLFAIVSLSRDPVDGVACRGAPVSFTCVTDNDALSWLDSKGATLGSVYLGTTSSIGDEQVVMNFNLNLTNISMSVLTSTASTNASENAVVLQCADGAGKARIGIVNGRPSRFTIIWFISCLFHNFIAMCVTLSIMCM